MWIEGVIVHPKVLKICDVEELHTFKAFLGKHNLKLFGFSTHDDMHRRNLIEKELGGFFITKNDIGEKKGSPKWIEYIERNFSIPHNKLIYIGCGIDRKEWLTATNSSVFYIHYTKDGIHKDVKKYTLSIKNITKITKFIEIFFTYDPLYTYKKDFNEKTKLRILFDAGVVLRDYKGESFSLQDLFTYDKIFYLGKEKKLDARSVLFLLLIIQLWKENLASRGVIWCVYPSAKKGKVSRNIEPYLKLFRGFTASRYDEVLVRVGDTIDKSDARRKRQHSEISFDREKNTLKVNTNLIKNKNVIVVDDFSTTGMSLEIAKNLILSEGANSVVLCAVGKYGKHHERYNLNGDVLERVSLEEEKEAQESLINLIDNFNDLF